MKEFSELYRLYSGKIILGGVKMKIKKFSTKKVIYAIILLVILLSIGFIWNAFNGNPVSKYFAKNEYKKYVKETYPNTDFEVSEAFYNFKDGKYGARIVSEIKGLNFRIDRRYDDVINDEYRDNPRLVDYENSLRFKEEITAEINDKIKDVDGSELMRDIYVDIAFPQGKYNEKSEFNKDIDDEIKIQVNFRRETIKEKTENMSISEENKKVENKVVDKHKKVVEKPVKDKELYDTEIQEKEEVAVIDDELINIAYEIKEVIINSGYKGLSVIGFEFVDENYNYEYILLEKENFNTSKDGLMNFKAKDASIFYKTEDDDEIVKLGIDVKETLISIEGIEELRVYENKLDGGCGQKEAYIKILKEVKPTRGELSEEVFNIKEIIKVQYPEIKYLNIEFYEYGELNAKGGNWGQYYGSIFIGNEFAPWEISQEEANIKLKVWEGL